MSGKLALLIIACSVPMLAVAGTSDTTAGQNQPTTIDLLREFSIRIDGARKGDEVGRSVAGIGDMNRDGRLDVIVGAPGADTRGRIRNGAAYVVFGQRRPAVIDLARLGRRGFRIDGRGAQPRRPPSCKTCHKTGMERIGYTVAGAGDVNGDRRPDVILGAAFESGDTEEDRAYVVFGKSSPGSVDLRHLAGRGFRMRAKTGRGDPPVLPVVAGAGDVNGDRRADALVGTTSFGWCSPFTGRCFTPFPESGGGAYVVFGERAPRALDLQGLRERGFRVIDTWPFSASGSAVAGAGDVNGDGRSDLVVGASRASYVVFGKPSRGTLHLDRLGPAGFRIDGGPCEAGRAAVAGAGDVNRDRYADVIVVASGAPCEGAVPQPGPASAYVVFGKASSDPISLSTLGARGYRIVPAPGEGIGAVRGAGDANGDRRPDVLVGAPGASRNGRRRAGSLYVAFGTGSPEPLDLASAPSRGAGFRIDGPVAASPGSSFGSIGLRSAIDGAGDVDRDGKADVIAGSPSSDNHGRRDSGSAYIVFSP